MCPTPRVCLAPSQTPKPPLPPRHPCHPAAAPAAPPPLPPGRSGCATHRLALQQLHQLQVLLFQRAQLLQGGQQDTVAHAG